MEERCALRRHALLGCRLGPLIYRDPTTNPRPTAPKRKPGVSADKATHRARWRPQGPCHLFRHPVSALSPGELRAIDCPRLKTGAALSHLRGGLATAGFNPATAGALTLVTRTGKYQDAISMTDRLLIEAPEYVNRMTYKRVFRGRMAKIKTVKHINRI